MKTIIQNWSLFSFHGLCHAWHTQSTNATKVSKGVKSPKILNVFSSYGPITLHKFKASDILLSSRSYVICRNEIYRVPVSLNSLVKRANNTRSNINGKTSPIFHVTEDMTGVKFRACRPSVTPRFTPGFTPGTLPTLESRHHPAIFTIHLSHFRRKDYQKSRYIGESTNSDVPQIARKLL